MARLSKEMRPLYRAVLKVVDQAARAGDAPRRAGWKLRTARVFAPGSLAEMLEDIAPAVVDEAIAAGALPPQAADDGWNIDWDKLLEFIQKLLDIILAFILAL